MSTNGTVKKGYIAQVSKSGSAERVSVTVDFTEGNEFNFDSLFGAGEIKAEDAVSVWIENLKAQPIVFGPAGQNAAKFPYKIAANAAHTIDFTFFARDGFIVATDADDQDELEFNIQLNKNVT